MPLFVNGQPIQLLQRSPSPGTSPAYPDEIGVAAGDFGSFDIQGSTKAELRLTELDQTDPAGRYRWQVSGDQMLLQRAATAAWATATTIGTWTSGGGYLIPDDQLLRLGTGGDQVLVNRSTLLAANTALTNVLIGTPITPEIAANSLILSNITASGDLLVAVNLGGNSLALLWVDTSAGLIWVNEAQADYDFRVSGDTLANLLVIDAGLDALAFGVAAVAGAFFSISPYQTNRTMASAVGLGLHIPTGSHTDQAGAGTTAIGALVSIGIPTFAGSAATRTYTDAATVYIVGVPVAGALAAITNTPVALWVDAGATRLDGEVLGGNGTVSLPEYSFWGDPDSGVYVIGANNLGMALGGLKVWDYAATVTGVYYASADAVAYELAGYKARGTVAIPTVITTGDDLLRIAAYGYSGVGGYVKAAEIRFDSAGTIATTRVAGQIIFATGTDAAPTVLTDRLILDQAGNLLFNTTTAQGNSPGVTLRGASANSVQDVLSIEQINTGSSAGVGAEFLMYDSASAVGVALRMTVEKNGAWTSGTATTYNQVTDFLVLEDNVAVVYFRFASGNDHVVLPNRPLSFSNVIGAPAALADFVRLGAADIAVGDTRLYIQSEAGSAVIIGNDRLRFAAAAGGVSIGATDILTSTTTLVTVPIDVLVSLGIRIGADSTNNEIDDATQGAASTQLFIGNASINVTSDARVKSGLLHWSGNALALLRQLHVVEYDMDEAYKPFGGVYAGRYVGLTAQNLYTVVPWTVNTQGGKDCWECKAGLRCEIHLPWQVKQDLLAGVLVKGIQELDTEIDTHDRRLAVLEDTKARLREALADPGVKAWLREELAA